MFRKAIPFFMHVITPLHAGSGSELGVVDLPIQREKHTDFPKIESSSLKGGLREAFEESGKKIEVGKRNDVIVKKDDIHLSLAFGPEDAGEGAHAGALGFTDARILLFPVKSMKGVFALVTCPQILERFYEELKLCGIDDSKLNGVKFTDFPINSVSDQNHLVINNKVVLEEYAFPLGQGQINCDSNVKNLANLLTEITGISEIAQKLIIISNDDFRDFVNLSTEVITRTKINSETGTVETRALFTEEFLPAETVMYSLALASKIFKDEGYKKNHKNEIAFFQNYKSDEGIQNEKSEEDIQNEKKEEEDLVMEYFVEGLKALEFIQLGGDATLGKGIIKMKVYDDKEK